MRWLRSALLFRLLPLFATLTLMGQPVLAYAGAGYIYGDMMCCCPDREHCMCRGEDGPHPEQEMRRCVDIATLVTPVVLAMVAPTAAPTHDQPRVVVHAPPPLNVFPEDRPIPPDVPPF